MHSQTDLKVRISDCDVHGHVNNATYLDYLSEATAEALPAELCGFLTPQQIRVDYHKPAKFGDELSIDSWFVPVSVGTYRVADSRGDLYSQARIQWRSQPELDAFFAGSAPSAPPPFSLKDTRHTHIETRGQPFYWLPQVQTWELTAKGLLSASTYLKWAEAAITLSSSKRGWPRARLDRENWASYVIHQGLEVFAEPDLKDGIAVETFLHEFKRLHGSWRVDFLSLRTGLVLARSFVGGVFVTLQGEPALPPAGMLESLLLGEPVTPI